MKVDIQNYNELYSYLGKNSITE